MFLLEVVMLLVLIYLLFYIISLKSMGDNETLGAYECGFSEITKVRSAFSYRFFLIGILFLVFDVEIALMLPLPFLVYTHGVSLFMLFVWVLIVGLVYEYYYGSLIWL